MKNINKIFRNTSSLLLTLRIILVDELSIFFSIRWFIVHKIKSTTQKFIDKSIDGDT